MEFHFRMYGVSRRMCYVCVTYVWLMKCTRDVYTTYVLRSILICGVSALHQLLFNTYENKRLCSLCSCSSHIIAINYQGSKMPPEKSRATPKEKKNKCGGGGGGGHLLVPHPGRKRTLTKIEATPSIALKEPCMALRTVRNN